MEDNPLAKTLQGLIAYEGKITFERFMRQALYHPALGYYRRKDQYPAGREGDYITAPELTPVFGKCLARVIETYWKEMGSRSPFDIVELGAGKGALALAILEYAETQSPEFYNAIRYTLIEQSIAARSLFKPPSKYLEDKKLQFHTLRGIANAEFAGCTISNEFFDVFSVHRVQQTKDGLREFYVRLDENGGFSEVLDAPITPEIERYWQTYGTALTENQQAEVALRAMETLGQIAVSLKSGYLLTIDYGADAEELYTKEHFDGTLSAYYQHKADYNFYEHIGQKDLTAHVNFTMIKKYGEKLGLNTVEYTTQQAFLMKNGIMDFAPQGDDIASQNTRLAVRQLVGQGGGFDNQFKVLVQKKI